MKLSDLAEILSVEPAALGERIVEGITSDSRAVRPGFVFAALRGGKSDGMAFASDAAAKGAIAVIAALDADAPGLGIPILKSGDPRRALALAAARFHGRQPETMVAVTGTSGKTSVAAFVRQIWAHAGLHAASIGTTGVVAPGRNEYGSLTTPDPVALQALLSELAVT